MSGSQLSVVHVLGQAHFGGIERLAIDIVNEQQRDPDVRVGLLFQFGTAGGLEAAFRATGAALHSADLAGGADFSPRKLRNVAAIFRQYDVLHLHGFNPLIVAAALLSRRPVVYTEHGLFGFGRPWRLADSINPRLLRLFLNHGVDCITFNSEFTARLARERYGLQGTDNRVIYNGIAFPGAIPATEPVDRETAALTAGRFVVGTSSRLAGFKRVDRLLDAFARFAPGRDTVLLVVGDGQLRPELEARAARLGIAGQTRFTGFRTNVRAYQEAMSVCVFPSENEPFGLVAVEALSLGKPTIVLRDGGGIVEVVGGLADGDVVDGVDGLAARLAWWYEHPEELGRDREARLAHARRFDVRATVGEFARIYREVCGLRGPARLAGPLAERDPR